MRRIILFLALSLGLTLANAQDQSTTQPSFPGGEEALTTYLTENIQYPEIAAENGIEGVVTLDFLVKSDGSIGEVKIVRMVDPDLEDEAIRVVKAMPKWEPGTNNGVAVDAWFRLPIKFRLPTENQ